MTSAFPVLRDFSLPKLAAMRKMLREGSTVQNFFHRVVGDAILPESVRKITDRKKAEGPEE